MTEKAPPTPLRAILRHLTDEQRDEFAALSGLTKNYLYQLAGCHRQSTSALNAVRIAAASELMAVRYGSVPVTVVELANMCPLKGAV